MTDRPILMSAPMVRALLDGRKTQTRRLAWRPWTDDQREEAQNLYAGIIMGPGKAAIWQSVKPKDRLWVRETWMRNPDFADIDETGFVMYRADPGHDHDGPFKPSIHMPRWASRITLVVTATKTELLHEISEEDARAEGFAGGRLDDGFDERPFGDTGLTISSPGTFCSAAGMAQVCFHDLYPDPSWDAYSSPECVVLIFTVHQQNIDVVA